MNCVRCHHTDEAHETTSNDSLLQRGRCMIPSCSCIKCHHTDESHESTENNSLLNRGKCMIPSCRCQQYSDTIKKIDEDLL